MLRVLALLLVWTAVVTPVVHAGKNDNQLIRPLTPVRKATVTAHPFINVIVGFGQAADGRPVDPSTFSARIGRRNVTGDFTQVVEDGALVRMYGRIDGSVLKLGRKNRVKLKVRSVAGSRPRVYRDVDKVLFRVVEAANEPPVALLIPPTDLIIPDTPLEFDGSESRDPESDLLTYAWDFNGDDVIDSTEPKPTHVFPVGTGDTTVRLTVSDGQLSATTAQALPSTPPLAPGRTPGVLSVEPAGAGPSQPGATHLEFEAVALGESSTRTLWIRNPDDQPTSQLRVRLDLTGADFTLDPTDLDLGPDTSAPGSCDPPGCAAVTVTFTPTGGHRSARVVMVASATNQPVVQLLAHGYGGAAPGTGPTFAAAPVFFTSAFGTAIQAVLPGGERVPIDNAVSTCQVPGGGAGAGDYCLRNADCAAHGGTCTGPSTPFETVDFCSDAAGDLYLLSDEDTYTDPTFPDQDERTVTLMRLDLDDAGTRTGGQILSRLVAETFQMTCDAQPQASGGRVLVAEFMTIDNFECFRCEQERLLTFRKSNGASSAPLMSRIDEAEGLDACEDDIDPVADLNVSADGTTVFAAFEDGGLYRIRPDPLPMSPDIFGAFQLHPDGSVLYAAASDTGATGILSLYKISPEQAENGAPRLADLTPCAVLTLPNNQGRTFLAGEHAIAADRGAAGSLDTTVLLSFVSTGGVTPPQPGQPPPLPEALRVQGVLAIASPAGSNACTVLGPVTLERPNYLTF